MKNEYLDKFILDYKYENDSLFINNEYLHSMYHLNKQYLIDNNILTKYNNLYYLNYDNKDVLKIVEKKSITYLKNKSIRKDIQNIVNLLLKKYKSIQSIILIGSTARNLSTNNSDLDFLIITSRKIKRIHLNENIKYNLDFSIKTIKQFKADYKNKQELVLWALKYGITLYNESFLSSYRDIIKLNDFHHIINNKKVQINKYINFIFEYNKILDIDGILYYFKKIFYFLLRYYLYINSYVPKSKPELVMQIQKHNLTNDLILQINLILKEEMIKKSELILILKKIQNEINTTQ